MNALANLLSPSGIASCVNYLYNAVSVRNTTYTLDNNKTYIIIRGRLIECEMNNKYTITQCELVVDDLMNSVLLM